MQKILQVSIDSSLGINSGLLTSKEVIKLYDSYWNSFVFLSLDHELSQLDIFDKLVSNGAMDIWTLSEIPPVLTGKRSVVVISQVLQ